jgi:hypothetical protein
VDLIRDSIVVTPLPSVRTLAAAQRLPERTKPTGVIPLSILEYQQIGVLEKQ